MRAEAILPPFFDEKSVLETISDLLKDDDFSELDIAVAWAQPDPINYLDAQLTAFRARGQIRILVGADLNAASAEGLRRVIEISDEAQLLMDPAGATFHPKLFVFHGKESATVVLGSSNLTMGGFLRNYEVCVRLDLDRSVSDDEKLLQRFLGHIQRLSNDATSVQLDGELIKMLVDTGVIPKKAPRTASTVTAAAPEAELPFGRSAHKKRRLGGEKSKSTPAPGASGSASTTTATVEKRWSKPLNTASNSGRPAKGSHTTGALRFTKANQPIDQATWFRDTLFASQAWGPDPRPKFKGREIADVTMDVVIDGKSVGAHVFRVTYDNRRQANQRNFTTDLKWRPLTPTLSKLDLTDKSVVVELLSDGKLRLSITPTASVADSIL